MKKYISQLDAAVIIFPKFSALYFALITRKWRFNQSKKYLEAKLMRAIWSIYYSATCTKTSVQKKFKKFI